MIENTIFVLKQYSRVFVCQTGRQTDQILQQSEIRSYDQPISTGWQIN